MSLTNALAGARRRANRRSEVEGDSERTETGSNAWLSEPASSRDCLHLTLLWVNGGPGRSGETSVLSQPVVLGRGDESVPGDASKLEFVRQRPGVNVPAGALEHPRLSRRQWLLAPHESEIRVENVGRRALLHNGVAASKVFAAEGDTLAVDGVLVCLVEKRPRLLPEFAFESFPQNGADEDGIAGESPAIWRLRRELAALAATNEHCLVLGESGTGKELAARAIHRRSGYAQAPFVSRNAATIPESLVEVELFGNAANYPNVGAPARQGLVGQADGGTLFLDEVAELSEPQQANLLRVLDSGEYQRLGEDRTRRARFRLIGATNRPLAALKHDFCARFPERVSVPGLDLRRADVPLLLVRILETLGHNPAHVHTELVDALCRHRYTHHHRELERLARLARRTSAPDGPLRLTPEVRDDLELPTAPGPSEAAIREALARSRSAAAAAEHLGLPSRYALYRLMKKLGIHV
jgi:two-component system nitrogen regulation response regulator GlnG/two-component system response regulator HydG